MTEGREPSMDLEPESICTDCGHRFESDDQGKITFQEVFKHYRETGCRFTPSSRGEKILTRREQRLQA